MPLIECPQCHHRVSSVASACPECGTPIAERLWDEMRRGEYYPCGKCGDPVATHASVCRNCGVPDPRRKRIRVPPRLAVGVGVAAALLVTAVSSAERLSRPNETVIADTVAGLLAESADTVRPPEDAGADTVPALSPAEVVRPPDVVPEPPQATVTPPSQAVIASGPNVRWTSTWANVRSGRGVASPVVLTLNPDERLVVDSLRGGWWALVVEGQRVGFVANSVLRRAPADSTLP